VSTIQPTALRIAAPIIAVGMMSTVLLGTTPENENENHPKRDEGKRHPEE